MHSALLEKDSSAAPPAGDAGVSSLAEGGSRHESAANPRLEAHALPILLAAAALLALLSLPGSLRSDDVFSVNAVQLPFAKMMEILKDDIHPPLYYVLLFGWVKIFGTSEAAVRGLSGLLYVFGVWAMFSWGRRLGGSRAGATAAAIFMSAPLALLSIELVRMYTLLSLVSVLSASLYWIVFVERTTEKATLGPAAVLCIVDIVGTFTHVWFFFLLFAQGLHWLAVHRRQWLRFAVIHAAALTPYAILWLPVLLRQVRKSTDATAWMVPPGWSDLLSVSIGYGTLLAPALPFLIWWSVKRRAAPAPWASGTALMLISALAVPFLISQAKPLFYSRFTIIALPLFAVMVTALFWRVTPWQLSALLVGLAISWRMYGAFHPNPCDARSTATYLASTVDARDTIIFSSLSREPIDYYFAKEHPSFQPPATSFPAAIDSHLGYEGDVLNPANASALQHEAEALSDQLAAQPGNIHFLHGFHPEVDIHVSRALLTHFKLIETKSLQCATMGCYYNEISVYAHR